MNSGFIESGGSSEFFESGRLKVGIVELEIELDRHERRDTLTSVVSRSTNGAAQESERRRWSIFGRRTYQANEYHIPLVRDALLRSSAADSP